MSNENIILAIDPGNIESAFVLMDEKLRPVRFEKLANEDLLCYIANGDFDEVEHVAIEMVACYGMPVGKEVFDTCVYIGQLKEAIRSGICIDAHYIYRKDEKVNLCNSMKAKDGNIIQALVDRFAPAATNKGKGTKKNPGWFYGFRKDIWQAYAVGVTYNDLYIREMNP